MKRPSKLNRTWLMAGAAVVIIAAGGVWFTVSRAPSPAAVPAEGDHAEEEAGAPEGTLALSDAQISAAGIGVVSIMGGGGGETLLSGRVEPMIDARAAVSAVVGGRVERVLVAPGQSVRAGQALAVLVSGDAASLRADADAAQANAVAAQQAHAREESLADQGVVARRDAEVAHAQALGAEAAARAARARASAAGAPNASGRVNVSSPIAGVVTSVLVGPAGFAAQGGVIAEVTNPAWVEIVFNAPPALAVQVRSGSTMRVQGPAGEFEAQVTGVAAGAGAEGGAAVIRAHPTGSRLPPAGSAVTGAVVTGEAVSGMTVPSEAVQTVEGANVVFVRTATGFRAAPVLVGRQAAGRTEILSGLTASDRVAGSNAFLLKAELAKGEAEHGH
ncbi:efflux RND transporter periplasmic adaptor subunit [Brevundimonas mediterranea]|jgi:membrane fusion protein, heavy metal efflux system|uniref:Efflux RND transporter periplasmic adaptor subunit n=2 Tax=Brevundimonas TaxID=41275 RepID=A0AB37E5W3_9CAUL|nr:MULTISPECIES: efflux RND transporter periplasmic adaptor subunit [Brevundimonas]EDX79784.1 efflux transporter, RND family, MFP subunit [Brevundimonas sp. BAL3]MBA4330606.1 efflux RND transporter periplasmic adaptor subunit [Brevundimonas sp.]QIH72652.1 efflux RND transporter periplasmic adaptor subunit [Brevundimonas mediterranea]